jgi:hypothetical protein
MTVVLNDQQGSETKNGKTYYVSYKPIDCWVQHPYLESYTPYNDGYKPHNGWYNPHYVRYITNMLDTNNIVLCSNPLCAFKHQCIWW